MPGRPPPLSRVLRPREAVGPRGRTNLTAENIDYGLVAFGPNNRHNNSRRVDHPNAGSLHPEERHTTQAADGEETMQFCRADR